METLPRYRRTVAPYKPAKTPYVGHAVTYLKYGNHHDPGTYVLIREVEGSRGVKAGSYWVAPILNDGTIGPMTVAYVDTSQLPA
jgi:hypothetical protein